MRTVCLNLPCSCCTYSPQYVAWPCTVQQRGQWSQYIPVVLYLDNSSSYIAVFVITTACAAIIIGGVFARCWYLRRRTKSQNFAVLHKPKRFFEPPRQFKQSNGHATRRPSHDVNMNDDFLGDRTLTKASDLVFTKADIESTPRLKHQGQGLVSRHTCLIWM